MSQVSDDFLAARQRDKRARMTAQTAKQIGATFRLFADHVQDCPLDAVTRGDAAEFLDARGRLHQHYGRRPGAAKLSLAELLEKFPAGDGTGLSNKTLNRHQSALKSLFSWARKQGTVSGENPFAELAREKGNNPRPAGCPTASRSSTPCSTAPSSLNPRRSTRWRRVGPGSWP